MLYDVKVTEDYPEWECSRLDALNYKPLTNKAYSLTKHLPMNVKTPVNR